MAKIHGQAFLDWLRSFGVIPENTRRVVIDASATAPVVIYIEMYGSSKMLEVEPPPELRIKIVDVDKMEEEETIDFEFDTDPYLLAQYRQKWEESGD